MAEKKQILVVDDEMEMGSVLDEILSNEGYRVQVVYDPVEALDYLSRERFSLLISDLHMPQMDGVELVRRAKGMVPELPCVLVTGEPTAESAIEALRLGVKEYLLKPLDTGRLLATVKGILSRSEMNAFTGRPRGAARPEITGERKSTAQYLDEKEVGLSAIRADLGQKTEELTLLNEIGRVVATVLDLHTLLNLCLKLICSKLKVESSSVMLYLPQTDELIVRASQGPRRTTVGSTEKLGNVAAVGINHKKLPFLVKDIRADGRFRPRLFSPYKTSSLISVPLVSKGDFLGLLNVSEKRNGEPFTETELQLVVVIASQISLGLENVKLHQTVKGALLNTVQALSASLEAKDRYTSGHSLRVLDYATRMGTRFGLNPKQMSLLCSGAQLHDIGKMAIPEGILLKAQPLSSREVEIIREHPAIGEKIVDVLHFPTEVKQIVRGHHESFDGRGYPDGLLGESIPFFARIMRAADAFDAMTSARPYRPPLSHEEAWRNISERRGSEFDPVVVDVLADVLRRNIVPQKSRF